MQAQLIWLGFIIVLGIYTGLLWVYGTRYFMSNGRKLFLVLLVFELILTLLHASGWLDQVRFWRWLLNLDAEKNIPAAFSAIQLLMVGGIALLTLFLVKARHDSRIQLYWLGLAIIFSLIAFDEYYAWHEGWPNFEYLYLVIGIILVGATVFMVWLVSTEDRPYFWLILAGIGFMAGGGLGFDLLNVDYTQVVESQPGGLKSMISFLVTSLRLDSLLQLIATYKDFVKLQALEEYFEMSSVSFIIVTQLSYIHAHLSKDRWILLRKIVVGFALCAVVVFMFSFWVLPMLEMRFLAQTLNTSYLDGRLYLKGYRVSHEVITPKSHNLKLTLYWQATHWLDNYYGVSTHLLTYPEIHSVTQNDVSVSPPHADWLPGLIVKQTIDLQIPKTLEVERGYWLTVTVWRWPWWEDNRIVVESSDRELVTPDTLILEDIPARAP
jgi:hypothetical protein